MRDKIRKRLRAKRVGKHRRHRDDLEHIAFFAEQRRLAVDSRQVKEAKHRIPKDKRTHKKSGPYVGCECVYCK